MKVKQYSYYVGDFETTVYDGQVSTEVWASAIVPLYSEEVKIFHSLPETWEYIKTLPGNLVIYYHNLAFDGMFWLYFLMQTLHLTQSIHKSGEGDFDYEWNDNKEMRNNEFQYRISELGKFYFITIKQNNRFIELRDSLKLLPFSVKRIGETFGTTHKKLDMEYEGYRYAGCTITDEEKKYIANDVLVVKEALEIMHNDGHNALTIGACCLKEYKRIIGKEDYAMYFPNLYELPIPNEFENFGRYILKSYHGGWCYLVKGKENKIFHNGVTLDVNSLYPSVMHSSSGNYYPVGQPHYWKGQSIPKQALASTKFYYIRIRTRFHIKDGFLPFIQIKYNLFYNGTENLTTSDIYDRETNTYVREYLGLDGKVHQAIPELIMSKPDYELFLEHYDVEDFEIVDGCWFFGEIGLFDEYINHYKKIKIESKGAKRESAKLFLNNLYGKLASSTNSSFKVAYEKDDGTISFFPVHEEKKTPGYIAAGAAVTSYARCFTVRAAQKNYYGPDKPGFIYADTDSIHADLNVEDAKGIKLDDSDFLCWKAESHWQDGYYLRQKTYIEKENDEYIIRCAGMPNRCKELLEASLSGHKIETKNEEEADFIKVKRSYEDIKTGLEIPSNLKQKRIKGGIILNSMTYKFR